MLAGRELSEAEARTRLARKGFDADAIDGAIERLRSERALDDRRAAVSRARTEVLSRRRGRLRVVQKLRAAGFDAALTADVVEDVFAGLNESDRLDDLLARRLKTGEAVSDWTTAARLHRSLVRQGFAPDEVSAALRRHRRSEAQGP
jgi:regulatory protein